MEIFFIIDMLCYMKPSQFNLTFWLFSQLKRMRKRVIETQKTKNSHKLFSIAQTPHQSTNRINSRLLLFFFGLGIFEISARTYPSNDNNHYNMLQMYYTDVKIAVS